MTALFGLFVHVAVGVQMRLYVNSPPGNGSLSVSPAAGYMLSTTFTLRARRWADAEANYPLAYTFLLGPSLPLRTAGASNAYQVTATQRPTGERCPALGLLRRGRLC